MLESIREDSLRIALVTSSSRENLNHIVTPSQQGLFDEILWAESVTHSKPHPEPYLKAAEALHVAPSRCLVVENAVFGIRSARAAGAWCVAVASTLPPDLLQEAHHVLSSTLELGGPEVWRRILAGFETLGDPGIVPPNEELVAPIPVRYM